MPEKKSNSQPHPAKGSGISFHRSIWAGLLLTGAVFLIWYGISRPDSDAGQISTLPDFGNASAAEAHARRQPAKPLDYTSFADYKIPPLSPEDALGTFELEDGFRIEIVAHEPDVIDPVAMDIDRDGRLWVVEMPSYMPVHDMEDEETSIRERVPQGRVVVLEDTDGDGRMDDSRIFMDELILPRAIKVLDDGVLIAEPPNVWFIRDTTGNGIGDTREIVDDNYGEPVSGNVEHMPNGLMWGMDNWIHSSHSGVESLRRVNGEWISRPFEQLAQWGMTQDDWGRLYSAHNTRTLNSHLVPYSYSQRHPEFDLEEGIYENIAEHETMWPAHATGVNRGYREGILREDGTLSNSTAAAGPVIYRGDQFGDEYRGNAFIPEPAGNLIKRLVLDDDAPGDIRMTARFAYEGREFLTSTDERFRPVNAYNAPDGSIYIIDMYRGIFQHARFLTDYLRDYAVEHDLHRPEGRGQFGRIYRIVKEENDIDYKTPKLGELKPAELAEYLHHENGLLRDHAQQLLVQRSPARITGLLEEFATDQSLPFYTRLQALWTLEGYDSARYSPERLVDLAKAALEDPHPRIRAAGIRILERLSGWEQESDDIMAHFAELAKTESAPYVKLQLLASLGEFDGEEALRLMAGILDENPADTYFQEMALTGVYQREAAMLQILRRDYNWNEGMAGGTGLILESLEIAAERKAPVVQAGGEEERRLLERGESVFQTCMACHGSRGEGVAGVAPSLDGSGWVTGDPAILARIILQGFANDENEGSTEVMPAHRFLQDDEIAAVMTYIRRSWSNDSSPVSAEEVTRIREITADRRREWTPGELRELQE